MHCQKCGKKLIVLLTTYVDCDCEKSSESSIKEIEIAGIMFRYDGTALSIEAISSILTDFDLNVMIMIVDSALKKQLFNGYTTIINNILFTYNNNVLGIKQFNFLEKHQIVLLDFLRKIVNKE